MDYSPMAQHIETERLLLSPEVDTDAEWLAELFSERGTTVTTGEARERIKTMNQAMDDLGIGVLVLRVQPSDDPIGYCGLIVGRCSVAEPELAYELLAFAHGNGYATEAARAVLEAAFETGRRRIWATVRTWNAASLRVLAKVGFREHHTTVDADGELVWLVCER